jgi:hypothetical protein
MPVHSQSITVGNRIVGAVSIDGGTVRGDGGPIRPQLVIPVKLQLNPTPENAQLAVCYVSALLSTDQNASPHAAVCQPASATLMDNFNARSIPHGPVDHTVQLRFLLSPAEVEDLERKRHAGGDVFALYCGLDLVVAGLKTFNEVRPGQAPEPTPWDLNFGLFSQVMPFWTTRVQPVGVQMEQSTWVRSVLPGLGYDRVRLLELTFPPPLPENGRAARQFDKARQALDGRRYGDCIQECRGLLNMWERQFKSTMARRVADIVASDRHWPAGDIRRDLLDVLWKEVGDIANAPHHPEGDVDAELLDERDARLVLLLTVALSEYVEPC